MNILVILLVGYVIGFILTAVWAFKQEIAWQKDIKRVKGRVRDGWWLEPTVVALLFPLLFFVCAPYWWVKDNLNDWFNKLLED